MKNLNHSDRRFFAAIGAFSLLLLGGVWWWNSLNAMPQVTIPNPKMPSPNAFDIYAKAYRLNVARPDSLYENYDPKTKMPGEPSATFEGRLRFYRKPELQQWLAKNQQSLKTLRQGFKIRISSTTSARIFESVSPLRQLTRNDAHTIGAE